MHHRLELNVTLLIDNSKSISDSGRASIEGLVQSLRSFLMNEKSSHQGELEIYIWECLFSNSAQWNALAKPVDIYSYTVPPQSSGASNIGSALKELFNSIGKHKLEKNIVIVIGDGMITDNPEDQLEYGRLMPVVNDWLMLACIIGELEKQYASQYEEITKDADRVFSIHEQEALHDAIKYYIESLLHGSENSTTPDSAESEQTTADEIIEQPETITPQNKDLWD